MENRYYTPKIEEFHEGFEYEYFVWDSWQLREWRMFSIFSTKMNMDFTKIRVKEFNQEDLAELSFFKVAENDNISYFQKTKEIETNNLTISFGIELNPTVEIMLNSKTVYNGIIRNKSHFKQVLNDIQNSIYSI